MKKIATLLVMTAVALTLNAQGKNMVAHRQAEGYMRANPKALVTEMLSDITPDQQAKIESLRFQQRKESLMLANEIGERRAQLRTLEQVDKPNLKAINSKIDEISALQNKKMKMNADHRSKVRALLSDEQRVQFDLNSQKRGVRMSDGYNHKRNGNRQFRNR